MDVTKIGYNIIVEGRTDLPENKNHFLLHFPSGTKNRKVKMQNTKYRNL